MVKIKPSEITPEHLYLSRRRFMKGMGALVASSVVLAACGVQGPEPTTVPTVAPTAEPSSLPTDAPSPTAEYARSSIPTSTPSCIGFAISTGY